MRLIILFATLLLTGVSKVARAGATASLSQTAGGSLVSCSAEPWSHAVFVRKVTKRTRAVILAYRSESFAYACFSAHSAKSRAV